MLNALGNFTSVCRFNILFFGGLTVWTLAYLPFAFLFYLFRIHIRHGMKQKEIRALAHFYGYICCRLLGALTKFEYADKNDLLPKSYIVTPNHQSFFDPYCVGVFPIKNQVFFVRGWPFRIPLYGVIMREAGYLNSENMRLETFFQKAEELLRDGAALVIYPEGTRSSTGELGRFRSGAFHLAMRCDVPIVPMCIAGTNNVFPKGKLFGRPAPVRVTLMKQVNPEDFRPFGDIAHIRMQRHVKAVMEDALKLPS